jgi:hypothetical protein
MILGRKNSASDAEPEGRCSEQFQEKCETVFRPELRQNYERASPALWAG